MPASPASPEGSPNAAKALGFTTVETYVYVILPMAMRLIVPPLTSEAMNLVKHTAVAMTIGLPELTMRANEMGKTRSSSLRPISGQQSSTS